MDFIKLTEIISTSHLRTYRDDDLFIDRMSHRYSVVIFTTFAVLVTTKAYIGDPIDCWAPPEFKASYERYAETLCFVNGTYFISSNQIEIPNDDKRYANRIRYYQWTPFIFLMLAFLMYMPRLLWLTMNSRYGLNIKNLVDAAKKYEGVDSCKNKLKILTYICKNLLRNVEYTDYIRNRNYFQISNDSNNHQIINVNYLNKKSEIHQMLTKMQNECDFEILVDKNSKTDKDDKNFEKSYSYDMRHFEMKQFEESKSMRFNYFQSFYDNYLSRLYTLVRFIYLISFVGQFIFLSHLIGNDFYKIGLNLIMSFYYEIEWPQFKIFPRLTFCEIYIREIGTVHPYLIQCVLRINLFNEVLFIVVWFWLIFLIAFSSLDFLQRFFSIIFVCSNCEKKMFALKYLELIHLESNDKYFQTLKNTLKKDDYVRIQKKSEQKSNNKSSKMKKNKIKHYKRSKTKKRSQNNKYNRNNENIIQMQTICEQNNNDFTTSVITHSLNNGNIENIVHARESKNKEQEIFLYNSDINDTSCRHSHSDLLNISSNNNNNQQQHDQYQQRHQQNELDIFEKFCFNYFNNDTIFALKLIEKNASSLIISEIIEYLWINYKAIYLKKT